MPAPGARTRRGSRLPTGGGALFPIVGLVVGLVLLSATIVVAGQDSSSGTDTAATEASGIVTADSAVEKVAVPAANRCTLLLDGARHDLSVVQARTLTQVVAVGWQVKAPEDMVARVLDIAAKEQGPGLSVTATLDLFTREDGQSPTAGALSDVRAVSLPGALTCAFDVPGSVAEKKGSSGLTPRAEAMRKGVIDSFGKLSMAGFGAKTKPETSAQSAGRALTVRVPTAFTPGDGHGWVIAYWLAARGADYRLDTIAFGDHVWAPSQGWQAVAPGTAEANQARGDRVYVSVEAGTPPARAVPSTTSRSEKDKAAKAKAAKQEAAKQKAAKQKAAKKAAAKKAGKKTS